MISFAAFLMRSPTTTPHGAYRAVGARPGGARAAEVLISDQIESGGSVEAQEIKDVAIL